MKGDYDLQNVRISLSGRDTRKIISPVPSIIHASHNISISLNDKIKIIIIMLYGIVVSYFKSAGIYFWLQSESDYRQTRAR